MPNREHLTASFSQNDSDNPKDASLSDEPYILKVHSKKDAAPSMIHCGEPTTQKRINYRTRMHDKVFKVPGVWVAVCNNCSEIYFDPAVDDQISEKIFKIQFPLRARHLSHIG